MPIDLTVLSRQISPETTALILGSGVSIPSGAPSGIGLRDILGEKFSISEYRSFSLSDLCTIIEGKHDRYQLVTAVRKCIRNLQPAGGLLNIPLFSWASIFSTNYDDLVEKAYARHKKPIKVFSTNHDFHGAGMRDEQEFFKFHGTIEHDVCDNSTSRLILTSTDYDELSNYRELLYSRLSDQLFTKSVLIVGQSLADPDLRTLIDEAQRVKSKSGAPGRIILFIFDQNEDLATVFEARGLSVCFGGIDELFNALVRAAPSEQLVFAMNNDAIGVSPILESATSVVSTERANQVGELHRMFSGRPASYADIARGWTFDRDVANKLETQLSDAEAKPIALVLGTAGVGKTTGVRQALSRLVDREIECWEHKGDFAFETQAWVKVDAELRKRGECGVLFIDEAHLVLRDLNRLIELLSKQDSFCLKLVLVSSRPHWSPRLKTAEYFQLSEEHDLSKLSPAEINGLLDLLEANSDVRELVEDTFLGFSRPERLARLRERCSSDMFVCMKNIFAFQSIDTIILEEFASLDEDLQDIYRVVSGMQAIGAKIHRELIRRFTGLEASHVAQVLDHLDGIIEEYTVSERDGIYGWKVRHPIIAGLIATYKYADQDDLYALFEKVIETINPSYRFEVQSLNDMCDLETGVTRIHDRAKQNVLLRKMISLAPRGRVPRHRLIHNLIKMEKFDVAENEIRFFEKEFRSDGPVMRYKVRLKLGIAKNAIGIQDSDRTALAHEAATLALSALEKFPDDKNMYRTYLDTGVAIFKYSTKPEVFENAMRTAAEAQERLLDPELRGIISRYLRVGQEMGVEVY